MTNYLVRIYRRANNDAGVVGVAEEVGVQGNKSFINLDELWSILNSSKAKTGKSKKRNESLKRRRHKEL